MPFDPEKHHRRSIRLKGFDYSSGGLYFITICLDKRQCLFGRIENGTMILNQAGMFADHCWREIPKHFPHSVLHEYIIMPNHVHGIIELVNDVPDESRKEPANASDQNPLATKAFSPRNTIGSIVRGFKIGVTKWFRNTLPDEFPQDRRIWQRNYYESILWDKSSYEIRSNYVLKNPSNWQKDRNNPEKLNIRK